MPKAPASPASGGIQSVRRALDVLEAVAAHGGTMSVAQTAAVVGLPAPTTHRILRTLVDRGYMRQLTDKTYTLGFRLIQLGEATTALLGADSHAVLQSLVNAIGETANLAVLVGSSAEYVAQVPARYSMRMFTEVGRRVDLHATGVGKALLAQLSPADVRTLVGRRGLTRHTPHTLVTQPDLEAELHRVREQGYSIDEEEQELGVRCVAVHVPHPSAALMAVSVSGPLSRMTDDVVARAVPMLQEAAERMARNTSPMPKK